MIVNFEILALVVVASAVLAKLFEAVKNRLQPYWDKLNDDGREIAGYGIIALCAALMWFTGLNMLPGFSVVWGPLGRILTCIIAGFGPGLVYDMALDKPEVAPAAPGNRR